LRYELATRQWIDLFPDRTKGLRKLIETIRKGDRAGTDGATTAASPPAATRPREPERAPILAAGSKEFEAMRTLLARHVGPIAKVLIEKAAGDSRTPEDLCTRLATHVRTESDRAAFLKAARAQLVAKA
jgi:serine/threonine-protein kinase